jgi:serine/threonine-protein kinase RsbT
MSSDTIVADEVRIPINSEDDILTARQQARSLALKVGFWSVEQTFIAIAVAELALNILQYAGTGEIVLNEGEKHGTQGVVIVARDTGPGIPNPDLALQEGYSTSGGPGLGLPGAKRLMDEFELVSEVGKGTTVTMKKWVR